MIFCVVKSGVTKAPGKTIEYRSFKNYSKEDFVNDLKDVDWEFVANKEDVDSAVSTWNKLFTNIADRHALVRKARIRGVRCPWMNLWFSQAMSQRNYLHRTAIKSNSPHLWSRYKKLKNYVNSTEMQKSKAEYYSNLMSEQSSPISCIEADGLAQCDNPSIAKILNVHFSTIGTKLAIKLKSFITLPSPPARSTDLPKFVIKPITEEFVRSQLKQLRTNKAIGLDNISAHLLKDSASAIGKSLTKLFNQSLVTRTFPSLWRFGKVSALFKKGDRCDPNNYRPITVLLTLSKILEKAVHNQLYYLLNDSKIITSKQFGFRPKLSHFTDNVLLNMDSGHLTGAVFLDLSQAFDTVDHNLLLHKLKLVRLSDDTVNWFQSYLANRKQRTSVGDALSVAAPVTVGAPQGSILGPLLFLIYVNDLPSCQLANEIILCADDTVIYYSSTDLFDLESKLNSDLATISNWFSSNLLTLNILM